MSITFYYFCPTHILTAIYFNSSSVIHVAAGVGIGVAGAVGGLLVLSVVVFIFVVVPIVRSM